LHGTISNEPRKYLLLNSVLSGEQNLDFFSYKVYVFDFKMRFLSHEGLERVFGLTIAFGVLLISVNGKRTEQLDDKGRLILEWELNTDQTEIIFELSANTTGFVGFGISPQGGMTGADIFIAGVDSNGVPYSSVSC